MHSNSLAVKIVFSITLKSIIEPEIGLVVSFYLSFNFSVSESCTCKFKSFYHIDENQEAIGLLLCIPLFRFLQL